MGVQFEIGIDSKIIMIGAVRKEKE
jgi:hypothetical protein